MRLLVAVTGSSGIIYGIRLLETLQSYRKDRTVEIHLIISNGAKKVLTYEHPDISHDFIKQLADIVYDEQDLAAAPASGSYLIDAMIIVPCSMKTLAAIAHGYASNLITRAADVFIKQKRTLLLVPRESPFSVIHLENMLKLAKLGVHIVPPIPAFYTQPKTVDDIVNFTVGRVLDLIGLTTHNLFKRWDKG